MIYLRTARSSIPAGFFASPSGNAGNSGAIASPWDLQTALNGGPGGAVVQPGDTVWLRGGTYTGRFTCSMAGTAQNPISVRPYAGDGGWWTYPAKIDNGGGTLVTTLGVQSSYVTYQEIELLNSAGVRKSGQNGSWPTDINSGGGFGTSSGPELPGNRIINCLVHDTTDGIALFSEATNALVYGNLVYNVGWDGLSDRGHGHCCYGQTNLGTYPTARRDIVQNIFVNGFNDEMNLAGSSPRIGNVFIDRCVCYNPAGPSALASGARTLNWSSGGLASDPANPASVTDSVFYIPDSMGVVSTPNYFVATVANGQPPFGTFTVTNNRFFANGCTVGAQFSGIFNGPNTITGNTFLQTIGTDNATITTGNFPTNSYITVKPGVNETFLFVNDYRAGRGHLVICNWTLAGTVAVDISSVVASGRTYEIRDASNYFAAPCLSGTYGGGTVNVPMTGLTCAVPLGTSVPKTPATTAPEFNTFVVIQTN